MFERDRHVKCLKKKIKERHNRINGARDKMKNPKSDGNARLDARFKHELGLDATLRGVKKLSLLKNYY